MILKTVRNPHIQSRKSNRNAVMLCVSDFVWTRTKNKEKSRFEHEPRYIRMLTTDHWSTEIKLSLGQCQSLTSFIDHSVIMQSLLLQLSERRSNCILFFFFCFFDSLYFHHHHHHQKKFAKMPFCWFQFLNYNDLQRFFVIYDRKWQWDGLFYGWTHLQNISSN